MTREQVWRTVSEALKPTFGRLLDVRDVRRVRRVVGDAWIVSVVLAAPSGDLHVAEINVEDDGTMTPILTADHVVEAAKNQKKFVLAAVPDELADFGDAGPSSDAELSMLVELDAPIETQIDDAIARGDRVSLNTARELLPRLLADHDKQGATLFRMAEVEVKLGEPQIAKGYLEASAREFADRFDLPALEGAAALALELDGIEGFAASPVRMLLEQSRTRLRPLDRIVDARSFAGLPDDVRGRLEASMTLRTLAPGETLVAEGARSENVFVVKSGLLGVWLEKPEGGSFLVRCCFPGWLLGESSVLVADEPRCTATLKAERVSEVWTLPAAAVRLAMEEDLAFGLRIAQTKQMHRIDSFFSMHETMGQLDVQVRDDMLSCIQRLSSFEDETVILVANEVPDVACLVARGSIGLYEADKPDAPPANVIEPDGFYGVRDAIHRIAPAFDAVARAGSTIAFFDAAKLQKLCERSPEQVVAVLERLG